MSLQLAAALLLSQTGTLAHLYCSWMFKGELHATNAGSGPHNSRSVSISNATSRKRAEECTGEEYWSKQCPENTFTAIHQVKPARSAELGSFLHTNTRATRPSTDGYRDPRAVHRSSSGNFFFLFFCAGKMPNQSTETLACRLVPHAPSCPPFACRISRLRTRLTTGGGILEQPSSCSTI